MHRTNTLKTIYLKKNFFDITESEDLVPFLIKNISKLCLQFAIVHLQKTPLLVLIDAKSLCSTLPCQNYKNPESKYKTRLTSMKSKAQMSRFHNWVNHVMKPCAFCRGITRIHRSPSRPRPAVRPTAVLINIHEHLI